MILRQTTSDQTSFFTTLLISEGGNCSKITCNCKILVPYHNTLKGIGTVQIPINTIPNQYRTIRIPNHTNTLPYKYRPIRIPYHTNIYHTNTVPYEYRTKRISTMPIPYHTNTVPYEYRIIRIPYHTNTVPYEYRTIRKEGNPC
jgi:hypothetical protein